MKNNAINRINEMSEFTFKELGKGLGKSFAGIFTGIGNFLFTFFAFFVVLGCKAIKFFMKPEVKKELKEVFGWVGIKAFAGFIFIGVLILAFFNGIGKFFGFVFSIICAYAIMKYEQWRARCCTVRAEVNYLIDFRNSLLLEMKEA